MKTKEQYKQESNYSIATEILSDPKATIREQILAQRIRGKQGDGSDTKHHTEHKFD